MTIESEQTRDRRDRVLDAIDDVTRDAIIDHFPHGAAVESEDRSAARHRLDHNHAEGLRPVDRKDQGRSLTEKLGLFTVVYLANELNIVTVKQGLDSVFEIFDVDGVDFGRNF